MAEGVANRRPSIWQARVSIDRTYNVRIARHTGNITAQHTKSHSALLPYYSIGKLKGKLLEVPTCFPLARSMSLRSLSCAVARLYFQAMLEVQTDV